MAEDLCFEEWVRHVFDHPGTGPQWWWDADELWDPPHALIVDYIRRLFSDPLAHLHAYGDEQIDRGLWFILSNGCSDYMFALTDENVALEARLGCIRSFTPMFERLFATRCTPHLSHLAETGSAPLNMSCYMWWDLLPLVGEPRNKARRELDEACLAVMQRQLAGGHIACQESGLHGLGHWHDEYPQQVERIIDAFLACGGLRSELIRYANAARSGCVQ